MRDGKKQKKLPSTCEEHLIDEEVSDRIKFAGMLKFKGSDEQLLVWIVVKKLLQYHNRRKSAYTRSS